MDLPQNMRTGELAELATKQMFVAWGWATAKDGQDIGYDLFVQPDSNRYKGQRFLVQVKGTARPRRGGITAQLKKARLRQYLANPHPVFIVRSTADGVLYWLHAQRWAESNRDRLEGEGKISVGMDIAQRLEDKDGFMAYLDQVLAPPETVHGSLAELARKRGRHLSSFDPRLSVAVSTHGESETYTFMAAQAGFSIPIEMVHRDLANAAAMEEAMKFGLPVSMELEGMKVSGSPLFSELQLDQLQPAKVDIQRDGKPGTVTLIAGVGPAMSAPSMEIAVDAYHGPAGATMRSRRLTPTMFELRLDLSNDPPKSIFKLGLDMSQFSKGPLARAPSLAEFGTWATASLLEDGFVLSTSFSRTRTVWPLSNTESPAPGVLRLVRDLYRLQCIARQLDSDFTLHPGTRLVAEDIMAIEMFYNVLCGHKVVTELPELRIEGLVDYPDIETDSTYCCNANHLLPIAGVVVGTIPLKIELVGYERIDSPVEGSMILRSIKGSTATIELTESAVHDLHVTGDQNSRPGGGAAKS
ncbi:DUF4365 domain-containing protein [Stenotrophomonas sp.]|uniref:DUF4365 domain-containing protein n=1 Tax=Stenotrophomonas sp. TaxID=69392 RepID=UPI0028AE01DD|nr:DUF4365 domain-containing protein [Stenotrophomonas sp.]